MSDETHSVGAVGAHVRDGSCGMDADLVAGAPTGASAGEDEDQTIAIVSLGRTMDASLV